MADGAAVNALFNDLKARKFQIHVLVNGAGISGGGITANITDVQWLNVINTKKPS